MIKSKSTFFLGILIILAGLIFGNLGSAPLILIGFFVAASSFFGKSTISPTTYDLAQRRSSQTMIDKQPVLRDHMVAGRAITRFDKIDEKA